MKTFQNEPFVLVYNQNGYQYHVCCFSFRSAMKTFKKLEGVYQAEIRHKGAVYNVGRVVS